MLFAWCSDRTISLENPKVTAGDLPRYLIVRKTSADLMEYRR